MVGGFVATASSLALFAAGALPGAQPSLVIAASITVLLSGSSVVGAVQDAISAHFVTAAGRAAEVALLSAGLLTGVILGLKVGLEFGFFLDPAQPLAADVTRFGISTFAAAWRLRCPRSPATPPALAVAAAVAGGSAGAYGALTLFAHFGPVVATGLAAVLVGLAGELIGRGTSIDRHVIILSGIIRCCPGYRVPRLLPVGLRKRVRGGRPGHHHARTGHRPRPRRRCDVRPVRRPAPFGAPRQPRLAAAAVARALNRSGPAPASVARSAAM